MRGRASHRPQHHSDCEQVEFFGGINNLGDDDPPVVGSAQIRANTWPATYDYNGHTLFIGMTVRTL